MEFHFPSTLPVDDMRERTRALGDYFQNKHGMQVQWLDDNTARVSGKYKVLKIEATVALRDGGVDVTGTDPGRLLRGAAQKYLTGKLATYMAPGTGLDALPRR